MPVSHSSELIALVGLTWNAKSYDPGDRFQPKLLPHQRRTVDRMVNAASRKLGELSAANMAIALERRPSGAGVPAGFTLAGLLALNLITEEQVQKFGWGELDDYDTEQQQEQQQQAEPAVRPDWLDKDTEAYPVDDLWVVRVKANGNIPRFDVVDAKGERVLPGGTIAGKKKGIEKAEAIIAARPPAEEKDDTLMGSSILPAIVEIAGHKIQLGGIVAAAFEDFSAGREGVTDAVAEWNDLASEGEGGRDERLQAMIDLMTSDPDQIAKRVPQASIVEEPAGGGREDLEQLRAIAAADLDSLDGPGLRAWLKDQDMHAPDTATDDEMREAAAKLRDAAKVAIDKLDAVVIDVPRLEDGKLNAAEMQDDDLKAFILLGRPNEDETPEQMAERVGTADREALEAAALVADEQSDHPSHDKPAATEGNENGGDVQSGSGQPA